MNSISSSDQSAVGGTPKAYFLVIIVNGVPVEIETNPDAKLESVIEKALKETNNSGQSAQNWILTTAEGKKLDPSETPAGLKLPSGSKLFLNLKAGIGGQS